LIATSASQAALAEGTGGQVRERAVGPVGEDLCVPKNRVVVADLVSCAGVGYQNVTCGLNSQTA
jgi:hypothetical protein